jgi:hypothetical protein
VVSVSLRQMAQHVSLTYAVCARAARCVHVLPFVPILLGKPVFLSKEKRLNTKAVSAAGHPLANSTSAFALFINLPARCQPTSPPFKHYARFGLHING